MPPELIFLMHLVLGYVASLLCFGVYIFPRLKSMERFEAQRVIATVHSFRFFGLVFILPGVVGPNLPAGFATFAAYGDLATGILAILALLTGKGTSALLVSRRRLQSRGDVRHHARLLPRYPCRSSCAGWAVGCNLCDTDHLCAVSDDHSRRRSQLAASSKAQCGSSPHWQFDPILI